MTRPDPSWQLVGFELLVEAWIERDQPNFDVRVTFWNWLMSRMDDPYDGMTREPDFPSLWYCTVPATRVEDTAVHCAYSIDEPSRTVVGKLLATLSLPI